MSNDGSEIERHAGIDMVPVEDVFEWNLGADDGDPIFRRDFNFNLEVPNPVSIPVRR
jgi:hypothetical protein